MLPPVHPLAACPSAAKPPSHHGRTSTQTMDEVQAKLDELKGTMPDETYRQLCEETKRGRDAEVPLFEVKYIVNTIIGSHYMPG